MVISDRLETQAGRIRSESKISKARRPVPNFSLNGESQGFPPLFFTMEKVRGAMNRESYRSAWFEFGTIRRRRLDLQTRHETRISMPDDPRARVVTREDDLFYDRAERQLQGWRRLASGPAGG